MLDALTVHIEALEPMRVAVVAVTSDTPEEDAINALLDWARPQGLLDGAFRFFGYDNCQPAPNHTYTTWLTVNKDVTPSGRVAVQDVPGGEFAVTELHGTEQISPTWQRLAEWVRKSEYSVGYMPGLEEHLDILTGQPQHFKLYLSIR